MLVRKRGLSASSGTGMMICTLFAVLRLLNCAFAWMLLISKVRVCKVGAGYTYLEHVLYPASRVALDDALDPNQRLDLCVQPVAHELEFSVRWDKADGPVVLESTQPHALVELDIFHLDRLSSRRPTSRFEHDLIVQAQS